MRTRILVVVAVCSLTLSTARAENWPQFRGTGGTGVTSEAKLPIEWSTDKNVRWKVEVPGVAWSSPIVWGDKLFVTTAVTEKQAKPRPFNMGGFGKGGFGKGPDGKQPEPKKGEFPKGGFPKGGFGGMGGMGGGKPPDAVYRWEVYCLDAATGKVVWKQLAAENKPTIPIHATNTYASETPVTDGERVYAYFGMTGLYCFDVSGKPLWHKDLGSYGMTMGWGTGSSPALEGDRLFVQCDNEEKSFLV